MYKNLLVPIDGTPLSSFTVEQAVTLARSLGSKLTFLHARADYAATGDGSVLHTVDPSAFAELAAGTAQALLGKAAAAARAGGVDYETVAMTSDRPDEAIRACAVSQNCDLIFMASHGRRGIKGLLVGSVTQKVLQHATLPVLVAAVERNAPLSHEHQAVTVIRDEHRSLAAVMEGLRDLLRQTQAGEKPPDFRLLRAMLHYVEQFPERLHHPKESLYLFDKLRARSKDHDPLLDRLELQHAEGTAQLAQLTALLVKAEMSSMHDLREFAAAVEHYVQGQWQHMADEERLVIPAASQHLTATDWVELARAFGENGDPRFDVRASGDLSTLFERLLNLVANTDMNERARP